MNLKEELDRTNELLLSFRSLLNRISNTEIQSIGEHSIERKQETFEERKEEQVEKLYLKESSLLNSTSVYQFSYSFRFTVSIASTGDFGTENLKAGRIMADEPKNNDEKKIPMFTGDNFPMWERKMRMHLRGLKLFGIIEEPWSEEPSATELELSERSASALVKGLEDHVINAVVNDQNERFAHLIWDELQVVYASDSILSTFRVWNKWERIQYNFDMAKYIAEMEVSLAEINSIRLDVSGKVISCGIVGRITDKRPTLVQTLFADLRAVAEPRRLIAKLRDICNHEAVTKRKIVEEEHGSAGPAGTALSTSRKFIKKPSRNCRNGHNPNLGHTEDECHVLHPEKKPEWMKKRDKASAHFTAAELSMSTQEPSTSLVRPSFGYNSMLGDGSDTLSMVLDSGASHHMLNNIGYFQHSRKVLMQITTGNDKGDHKLIAVAQGDAMLKFENGTSLFLKNTLYVPDLTRNLISMVQLLKDKAVIYNKDRNFAVKIDNQTPIQVSIENFILEIKGVIRPMAVAMITEVKTVVNDFTMWHNRLGHASAKRIATSLSIPNKFIKVNSCSSCMEGKMTRIPFKSHYHSVSSPLEVVHGDLVGPISPPTNGGARYFLTLVDQFTGYIYTEILKEKSDATEAIINYKRFFEKQTERPLKKLITNGGGEFCNKTLGDFLKIEGIQHNVSPPYTPQHNGLAERANRTIIEMTRCMMMQANMAPDWWGEAVRTATATTNCLPTLSKGKTSPIYAMFKSKPNLNFFRPFGCRVWMNKPKHNRDAKFDSIAWEGVLIGYENDYSSYKVVRMDTKDILMTKHAYFDESTFPTCAAKNRSFIGLGVNKLPRFATDEPTPISFEEEDHQKEIEREEVEMRDLLDQMNAPEMNENEKRTHNQINEDIDQLTKSSSIINGEISGANILSTKRVCKQLYTVSVTLIDPKTHKQAMESKDSLKWKEAELKEINNMLKHNVWSIRLKLPEDEPIPATWAFRRKLGPGNEIIEYKARICAQGFKQTYGLNFMAKYAPTGKAASLRFLLSFAVNNNMKIHQLDVRSAFLTCPLEDKVTLLPPKGYEIPENSILDLNKAIYGLKQSPLVWYKRLTVFLKSIGFKIGASDPCVFWREESEYQPATWIFAHVDDLVIISKDPEVFKKQMEKEFAIKYLGDATFLLGMNIERFANGIQINQSQYIDRKLLEYGFKDEHISSCPINPREYLKRATVNEINEFKKLDISYRALIGSLNYLSILTRPDISYAVSTLSQYLENPGIKHYYAAVQIFQYLKGTRNFGLVFKKEKGMMLRAFADADWGNGPDTRRSTTGFVVTVGTHLVDWKSTKQATISLSSAEAEYKALSDLGRDLAWIANIANEVLIYSNSTAIVVYVDNKAAINLAKSELSQNSFRTKHMDIRLHFVRELVVNNLISLEHVKTTENSADFLTKPVGRTVIRRSIKDIGLSEIPVSASNYETRSTAECKNLDLVPNSAQRNPKRMRVTAEDASGKEAVVSSIGSTDRPLSDDVHQKNTSLLNRISNTEIQSIGEHSIERKQVSQLLDRIV
ncbi:hypothetical protein PSTT_15070 [Puccinia striiformis]|uniref:Integrase catalytic domain-containing protein n=1 Tax=Puccinia striiformis TaxID=27350 RepID=A0A2S4UJD1_9BASI|nr:hypothetical protein PSTT_15070 [Puccinia striiformis]